jgi:hypothetical protein
MASDMLFDFDSTKEKIGRQAAAIIPARMIFPEAQFHYVKDQVLEGKRTLEISNQEEAEAQQTERFMREGVRAYTDTIEKAEKATQALAISQFYKANAYLADIACGLYSIATNPNERNQLADVQENILRDKNGKETSLGMHIICTESAIRKVAAGYLVRDNGETIPGAGDAMAELARIVNPILSGITTPPRVYASYRAIDAQGQPIELLLQGDPIRIYEAKRMTKNTTEKLYSVFLDNRFFPVFWDNGFATANDSFIWQVAGLTAMLDYGRQKYIEWSKEHRPEQVTFPNTLEARRIMHTVNAAYGLKYFAPGIVKTNSQGRTNVILRRQALDSLVPRGVRREEGKKTFYNYKTCSQHIALCGRYMYMAMENTGLLETIKQDETLRSKILIPAMNKGAEFPEKYPEAVYIKLDGSIKYLGG